MSSYASNNESSFLNGPILLIFGSILILWTGWYYFHVQLKQAAFWFAHWQFLVYQHLPLIPSSAREEMAHLAELLPHMDPEPYEFGFFMRLWTLCAYGLRLFAIPLVIYLAIRLPMTVRRFAYRRDISMEQLVSIQAKSVFSVAVINGLKLHKEHPHIGPWRVTANPLQYALDNRLILFKEREVVEPFTADERLMDVEFRRRKLPDAAYLTFDLEAADRLYRNQLGKPWRNFEALKCNPPMYILAAAFCARIAGEQAGQDEYKELMGKVAFSFINPTWDRKTGKITKKAQFDVSGAMELAQKLISKYESSTFVQQVVARHGFEVTMLMGLLAEGRARSGKIPPSEFLWLRPLDRTLWYSLHQVGADTGWCEASGPWSHYRCELEYGSAIGTPLVEGGSDALALHLAKEKWLTTDLLDPELEERKRRQQERQESADRQSQAGKKEGGGGAGGNRPGFTQKRSLAKKHKT